MIKIIAFTFLLAFACSIGLAQQPLIIDSLKNELAFAKADTSRIKLLIAITGAYTGFGKDSGSLYGERALTLARQLHDPKMEATALADLSIMYRIYGDAPNSLEYAFEGLEVSQSNGLTWHEARCLYSLAVLYGDVLGDINKTFYYLFLAKSLNNKSEDKQDQLELNWLLDLNFAKFYSQSNQFDSANIYFTSLRKEMPERHSLRGVVERYWADMQLKMGHAEEALAGSDRYLSRMDSITRSGSEWYYSRALIHEKLKQPDSCIYYAKKALAVSQKISYKVFILSSSTLLADQYESTDIKQSLYYYKIAFAANDDLYGRKKLQEIQKTMAYEYERKKNKEAEAIAYRNKIKQYFFGAGTFVLLLLAFILFRNNLKEKKAKAIIQQQKEEVENTLVRLNSTQAQLIQSEKMASLGELTAGIAHEIQNPLNFVNNFSEVSEEMIDEAIGSRQEAGENSPVVTELLTDIKQNLAKINHHGKRADTIVKGMLQHSRSTTGNRELTDVNDLVDEYVKLSFHAFRGKDNAFDVNLQTDFDPAVGAIELAPQEVGRVLLNILNNAFYAVNERKKSDPAYTPEIIVQTKKTRNGIEISVKDNGGGIPESIVGKIFQPFFTTKPTGQGTGLGLSLSYDIVKAHGGELKVETETGKGSRFVVLLPIEVIDIK
jgi:signal transduction histidine kinase